MSISDAIGSSAGGAAGLAADIRSELLSTGGEIVCPRTITKEHSVINILADQRVVLTYFRAKRTETINTVRLISGATAASGLTLFRVGIYSEATNGDLTLVASTPNDTALMIATHTAYNKALSASFAKVAGQEYAVGVLCVGTTPPSVAGVQLASSGTVAAEGSDLRPKVAAWKAGQTDLPATITTFNALGGLYAVYTRLIP